jgi:hypothetical protein
MDNHISQEESPSFPQLYDRPSTMAHRGKEKARKLAKALAMKYLVELDPKKPHKYNVHELLGDELYALTRQVKAIPYLFFFSLFSFLILFSYRFQGSCVPRSTAPAALPLSTQRIHRQRVRCRPRAPSAWSVLTSAGPLLPKG